MSGPVLVPGDTCWAIDPTEKTGVLYDARDYYRAFYRAARSAQRFVCLMGWQFDSVVHLLRGEDVADADGPVELVSFLDDICSRNPDLHVYVLAWDFNLVYAMEREWFQKWLFDWKTSERVHFEFDSKHAIGGCHHDKMAIVDGWLAFAGGIDFALHRWDDRAHACQNPLRHDPSQEPYPPYHDVQAFFTGAPARRLTTRFAERWQVACGERIVLPHVPGTAESLELPGAQVLSTDRVAIVRTHAARVAPAAPPVREIRQLYVRAIQEAERFIYIETQYFTSKAVLDALVARMRETERSKLDIALVIPERAEAVKEEIAHGLRQALFVRALCAEAERTGHRIGFYTTRPRADEAQMQELDGERPDCTYIHSKVLVVDDRLFTLGSANLTNRSMGLDTEINVAWEARSPDDEALACDIREARLSLMTEHTGLDAAEVRALFGEPRALVARLDQLCDRDDARVERFDPTTIFDEAPLRMDPPDLALDPERPLIEEDIWEELEHGAKSPFAAGVAAIDKLLSTRHDSAA